MTIQELAQSYLEWFEKLKREGGRNTYSLKDGRPEELYDLVYEAHCGKLPDDWSYNFIQDVLCNIADADDPEDIIVEPDIYNHDLLNWLSSRTDRCDYVDEAVEEYGLPETKEFELMKLIAWGQLQEKREVFESVLSSLKKEVGE